MIYTLSQAPASAEVTQLQQLAQKGFEVVPTWVLDGLEAEFYALNNLPEQLQQLFNGLIGSRLDELKLEKACLKAEQLVRTSYLLPERAEQLLKLLPEASFLVRYATETTCILKPTKQEALWAVKQLWASGWQLESLITRLPQLAPENPATLIQQVASPTTADAALSEKASKQLSKKVEVHSSQNQLVVMVKLKNS